MKKQLNLNLKPLVAGIIPVVGVVLFIFFQHILWPDGLGFAEGQSVTRTVEKNTKGNITKTVETIQTDHGKTLWDWLSLLGVPLTLAVLGYFLQQAQQRQAEELAKEQRELASDETKEEVLQVYFDRLSVLLVDKNLLAIAAKTPTAGSEEKELLDSAIDVIRARTLSILRRFENDKERKTSVIRFLIEADIIGKLSLSLTGANLGGASLSATNLSRVDLSYADLSRADLMYANLSRADLSTANLSRANLMYANLIYANLSGANLSDVNLSDANLSNTNLSDANLSDANLSLTDFSLADLSYANLSYANLSDANLSYTDLSGTNLSYANLSGTNLNYANLSTANLSTANLSTANLSTANLGSANLSGANFSNTDLSGANLGGANLNSADLSNANLSNADLTRAKYNNNQIKKTCGWESAIYTGAKFDQDKLKWNVEDEAANQKVIKIIKQDTASDPAKPPDCSKWNYSK